MQASRIILIALVVAVVVFALGYLNSKAELTSSMPIIIAAALVGLGLSSRRD